MKKSTKTAKDDTDPIRNQLAIAQAKYLQSNLYVAAVGTTAIFLVLCYFFWGDDIAYELIEWLAIGLFSSVCRILLIIFFWEDKCFDGNPSRARKYIHLYSVATLCAGIAFGFGWLMVVPHLSSYEQLVYLLSIVALLFGGLFAYAPYFPAYLGFSSTALWLAPLVLDFAGKIYVTGLAFGIGLISLVSTMFAYRFSEAFKTNRALEFNIYSLLREVTIKRDEAVAANLSKSRFLASISHDLRQPMQAVSLTLNSLQQLLTRNSRDRDLQGQVGDTLSSLQHSVQYLNSMFEALVDISRLDARALTIKMEYQEIDTLLRNLEFEFSFIAKKEGLRFELSVPKNMASLLVNVDLHSLERLLRNLLSNAIRYTSNGGVRLSVRYADEMLDVRVIDTGVGVPLDMRSNIFDEFIQLRQVTTKDKNVGMGLGLSIAKRLAEILGTSIRLHSHRGVGSVFAFRLPCKTGNLKANVSAVSSNGGHEAIAHALIAVIDDDNEILLATKSMLEIYGAEVVAAESGVNLIQAMIFSSRPPDLIISDYRLIGETGLQCVQKIRDEFNEDIPAIIVTGDTAPAELRLLQAAQMDVLYKPIPAEKLLNAIVKNLKNNDINQLN
jgi:signal transduction histidine kinase/ActR/RegA family two-component response regulator